MAQDVAFSQGKCTIYKNSARLDVWCLASQAMMPSLTPEFRVVITADSGTIKCHNFMGTGLNLALGNYDER
jgi:hypothetical protein